MIGLRLPKSKGKPLSLLCLGAHSDDVEIGAGATLLELSRAHPDARVAWQVFAGSGVRKDEARQSAAFFTEGFAEVDVAVDDFRDGFFPAQFSEVKARMGKIAAALQPDVVFTHCRRDLHQDHRIIADVTWQIFRNSLILEYEIVKYDGDLGAPNFYVPISLEAKRGKLEALERCFASQRDKDWFTPETFSALMRLRGVECRADSGYAEAFYSSKIVLGTDSDV